MRRVSIFTAIIATLALATPSVAGSLKKVRKLADFNAMAVGHKYFDENGNWLIINADGSIKGRFNKKNLVGAWNWQGQYFCRNLILGGKNLPTDCQAIYMSKTQLQGKRQKGKGEWAPLMTRE